jgi:hypothetical protein
MFNYLQSIPTRVGRIIDDVSKPLSTKNQVIAELKFLALCLMLAAFVFAVGLVISVMVG